MILHGATTVGILFDVDGTLIDSVDAHARAWTNALRDYGYDVPFAAVRRQIGKGGDQLLPVFLSREEIEHAGKALEAHRSKLFKDRELPHLKAFPEVRALFQRLLADGKRLGLASSAKQDELVRYKQIAGIADLVEAETSADSAEKSKPHPDIFEAALAQIKLPAANVIVVGDTPYDAEAAGKAGLRSIGVRCGGWSEKDLRGAGCSEVFDDSAALLAAYSSGS